MSEVEELIKEIVADATARHQEKAVDYYDALRRIIAICDENESQATAVIRMIAGRAID